MELPLTCIRHLGGTLEPGPRASGYRYASHSYRTPHTLCWMRLAVLAHFPEVPSLAGTKIQDGCPLPEATRGTGGPVLTSLVMEFELFDDESPKTCANFRRLCAGEGTSHRAMTYCYQELKPCYRGTFFHKIIPGFVAQGGDITMRVDNGANHYSSMGRGWFEDENKKRRHNEAGLLSMANNGPNSNGAQFFITTSATHERALNGRHVCFGRVRAGLEDFLREVAPFGNVEGFPSRYVVVVDCGEGPAPANSPTGSPVSPPVAATEEADDEGVDPGAEVPPPDGGCATTERPRCVHIMEKEK